MAELNQNHLEPYQMKPEDCWSCNAHLRPKSELPNFQAFFPASISDLSVKILKVIQGSSFLPFGPEI